MAWDLSTDTIKIYFLSSSYTLESVCWGRRASFSPSVEQREGQDPGSP